MTRVVFLWLLLLPPLIPAGFCPCAMEAAQETCCEHDCPCENDCPEAPVPSEDPGCPCQAVDYEIRGFLGQNSFALEGPAALPAIVDAASAGVQIAQLLDRDADSLFPSPPRFVLYLTLLI